MENKNVALEAGTILHGKKKYKIRRVLGQGGFGITYEATASFADGNIQQTMYYAIKEFFMEEVCCRVNGEVKAREGQDEKFSVFLEYFAAEAKRMREMCKHKGIVSVNEVFSGNGTSYYVMEFLDGQSLEDKVKTRGALTETETLNILKDVGEALSFLHKERMNHLDIKPENIMLVKDDENKEHPILVDFGLSRHFTKDGAPTSQCSTAGCSDGYSPIEQYAGIDKFSPEADVYALAATAVFMLLGKTPCRSVEMSQQWLMTNLPANISQDTQNALIDALRPSPVDRTKTVEAFLNSLPLMKVSGEEVQDGKTRVIGEPAVPRRKSNIKIDTKKIITGVAVVVAVVAIILGIIFLKPLISQESSLQENEPTVVVEDSVKTDTVEVKKEKPKAKPAKAKTNEPKQEKKQDDQEDVQETKATGTIDLGYAVYEGSLKNGKPHGKGTLTFKETHVIEQYDVEHRTADSGDVVEGFFSNGHLTQGKLKKTDGTVKSLLIGSV